MKIPILFILVLISCKKAYPEPLETVLQWKTLEFDYESEEQKQEDLNSGFYLPRNAIPFDVDVHYSNSSTKRIFMSIPRLNRGSPITLGVYTGKNSSDGVPLLEPYPSWNWHRNVEDCGDDKLVSVWGIKVDECGRLWVIDNGDYDQITCPRKVLVFDIETGNLLKSLTIPRVLVIPGSFLVNPKVDIRNGNCEEELVYIADAAGMSIIVYSSITKSFARFKHTSMYPDPKYSTVVIGGQRLEGVLDGVFGLALQPEPENGDRKLFYSALTSSKMNYVNTSVLKNQHPAKINKLAFVTLYGGRPNPATSMEIDRNGVSYFGYFRDPSSFHCWNTRSEEYGRLIDTIYTNSTTMQFASGVKVINKPSGDQELWVLTSRFFKAFYGPLDVDDVNFRIMLGQIPDVLNHTSCMTPNGLPRRRT